MVHISIFLLCIFFLDWKLDMDHSTTRFAIYSLDDQELTLVPGQRGKGLLVVNGFTFAKNNEVDNRTYWCCRMRSANKEPCKARARTTLKSNGLYKITVTQPIHNHDQTHRMLRKLNPEILDEAPHFK